METGVFDGADYMNEKGKSSSFPVFLSSFLLLRPPSICVYSGGWSVFAPDSFSEAHGFRSKCPSR